MISKASLIKCSATNFTKFGSKRYTLDELAASLGISKKTIYKYFKSKEELVVESVSYLIDSYKKDIKDTVESDELDPITCIILIYKKAFEHLKHYKPSFIFGLKKYYPKANQLFDTFRNEIVNHTVFNLLENAQQNGIINPNVNLSLFCELYFSRFEDIAFKNDTLIEKFSNEELLNHFIIFNLKGIAVDGYENSYFK